MQDLTLLGGRLVVGGYVAAHGAQKLFGSFGGYGLEATGGSFEGLGLKPGRPMAAAAGASELVGGLLTAGGLAGPIGPTTVGATMVVAAVTAHRGKGLFAAEGGPELPLVYLAAAMALAGQGPGRYSLDRLFGVRVSPKLAAAVVVGAAGLATALSAQAVRSSASTEEAPTDPATS